MKILFINKFLFMNGGSETYMFSVGRKLEELGHEVQYFGMEHTGRCGGNRLECYTDEVDFHSSGVARFLYPFKILYSREAKRKLLRVLEDFNPDTVHINNFNFQLTPSIIYAVKKYDRQTGRRTAIVYTAHDGQLVCPNHLMQQYISGERCQKCLNGNLWNCTKYKCIHGSTVKSLLGTAEGILYRIFKPYKKIDKVVAPSFFLGEVLSHNDQLKGRIITLHNFVGDITLTEEEKIKENYVLYFGRYSREKGIETLVKACREVPEIPFIFAGSGELQEMVDRTANIQNRGYLSGRELYRLIAGARFTVFASECYENCPFAVMESLTCGTPVLCADIGGAPELLEAGKQGELFEPGNADELKSKIELLWNDRNRIKYYTDNCTEINFDTLEQYCIKLLGIYKECGREREQA